MNITDMLPKPIRAFIKRRIRSVALTVLRENHCMSYIPYLGSADSFVVQKISSRPDIHNGNKIAIPPREFWLGYAETKEGFLSSGEIHANKMLDLTKETGFYFKKGDRILDFGCGPGRMTRHLIDLSASCEIWGTDINANYIRWCKENLSPPFFFATTTTMPHLPFEDNYFNFIYCGSVFTHIDDLAEAWLLELRRVLTPGGRMYLTIHDEHTMQLLDGPLSDHWFARYLKNSTLYNTSRSFLGMLVLDRGRDPQVFYNIDYFLNLLNSIYDVMSVTHEAYGYQTGIIVKKKEKPANR